MTLTPLQQPCSHIPTPQERDRDPRYLGCNAAPGQPCLWATRYDGLTDPPFHSERLESAAQQPLPCPPIDPESFRAAILNSGLI